MGSIPVIALIALVVPLCAVAVWLFSLSEKKTRQLEALTKTVDGLQAAADAEQKKHSGQRGQLDQLREENKNLKDADKITRKKLYDLKEELKRIRTGAQPTRGESEQVKTTEKVDLDDLQAELYKARRERDALIEERESERAKQLADVADLQARANASFRDYEQKYAEKQAKRADGDLEKALLKVDQHKAQIAEYREKALAAEKARRAAERKSDANHQVYLVTQRQLEAKEDRLRLLEARVKDAIKGTLPKEPGDHDHPTDDTGRADHGRKKSAADGKTSKKSKADKAADLKASVNGSATAKPAAGSAEVPAPSQTDADHAAHETSAAGTVQNGAT